MIRTSLLLPPLLKKKAQRYSSTLGISLSELIRKYLESVTSGVSKDTKDPLLDDERVFKTDAPKNLSKNHDDYLYGVD